MPSSFSAGVARRPRGRSDLRRSAAAAPARLWLIAEALDHLRGFAADLAGFNGKSVELSIDAPPVMVTPDLISAAVPALVQLLRNAVSHGIETPMERLLAGKPLTGALSLAVTVADGSLRFVVGDDGRGVDPVIAAAGPEALGKGIAEALDRVAPLGGRIALVPGARGGARFALTLPLRTPGRGRSTVARVRE